MAIEDDRDALLRLLQSARVAQQLAEIARLQPVAVTIGGPAAPRRLGRSARVAELAQRLVAIACQYPELRELGGPVTFKDIERKLAELPDPSPARTDLAAWVDDCSAPLREAIAKDRWLPPPPPHIDYGAVAKELSRPPPPDPQMERVIELLTKLKPRKKPHKKQPHKHKEHDAAVSARIRTAIKAVCPDGDPGPLNVSHKQMHLDIHDHQGTNPETASPSYAQVRRVRIEDPKKNRRSRRP
jgi:hypothetical protein